MTTTDRLTTRQLRVLLAVCQLYSVGRGVTVREVARFLGYAGASPNAVWPPLQDLIDLGLVAVTRGRCRTIVPNCTIEVIPR